jgi:two-component sensor histidine kinase
MQTDASPQGRWRKYALFAGLWTVMAVLSAAQGYVSQSIYGPPVSWAVAFRRSFEEWYTWGALSIGVLWLASRFPYTKATSRRWYWIHFVGSVAGSVAFIAIYSWLLDGQRSVQDGTILEFAKVFKKYCLHYILVGMTTYWLLVLAHHGWHYYRRYHERELHAAELQKQLAQAKLDALRMQLNPHFLFNTLHTISALIHEDPECADRIVARLSDLLRLSLDQSDTNEVPLRQELAFLDRYLEIEQIRFQDRLTVERNVEPDLLEALVPCLILQPIVENAIRHGIETREDMGRIAIRARRSDGMLELSVRDNGSGLPDAQSAPRREGIGLSNTRSRLRHLYGDHQRFELAGVAGGGMEALIVVPFRTKDPNEVDGHAG